MAYKELLPLTTISGFIWYRTDRWSLDYYSLPDLRDGWRRYIMNIGPLHFSWSRAVPFPENE